jgi:hypothetical protein
MTLFHYTRTITFFPPSTPLTLASGKHDSNEEDSQTFDRRVSPLVGAATHESNVWVLKDKGRKRENQIANNLVLEHI